MQSKLDNAVCDTKAILNSLGIEYGPVDDVEINFRAASRWGRCKFSRATGKYTIQISYRLLQEDVPRGALMDTVIHEFLHAHKDRMCHTGEWKRCAQLVNMNYGYNIKRCTSAEEKGIEFVEATARKESYKYAVICDGCGSVDKYKRKSKVVQIIMAQPKNTNCRCLRCGSRDFTLKRLF